MSELLEARFAPLKGEKIDADLLKKFEKAVRREEWVEAREFFYELPISKIGEMQYSVKDKKTSKTLHFLAQIYGRVLEDYNSSVRCCVNAGKIAFDEEEYRIAAGDFAQAAIIYSSNLKDEKMAATMNERAGLAFEKFGDLEKAADNYSKAAFRFDALGIYKSAFKLYGLEAHVWRDLEKFSKEEHALLMAGVILSDRRKMNNIWPDQALKIEKRRYSTLWDMLKNEDGKESVTFQRWCEKNDEKLTKKKFKYWCKYQIASRARMLAIMISKEGIEKRGKKTIITDKEMVLDSLKYEREAAKIFEELKEWGLVSEARSILGIRLWQLNQKEESGEAFYNSGMALFKAGAEAEKVGDIKLRDKYWNKAWQDFERSGKTWATQIRGTKGFMMAAKCDDMCGEIREKQEKYNEAGKHYSTAARMCIKVREYREANKTYNPKAIRCFEKAKNFKEADRIRVRMVGGAPQTRGLKHVLPSKPPVSGKKSGVKKLDFDKIERLINNNQPQYVAKMLRKAKVNPGWITEFVGKLKKGYIVKDEFIKGLKKETGQK